MPMYAILNQPLFEKVATSFSGIFLPEPLNPTQKTIRAELSKREVIYLLSSLEEAKQVADLYFYPGPHYPKVNGRYGLIIELTAEFTEVPVKALVNGRKIGGFPENNTESQSFQCISIQPSQIASILKTFIPEQAKQANPDLLERSFVSSEANCCVM